jgi:hypothetical protein
MGTPHWTPEAKQELARVYPHMTNAQIGAMFGKSPKAIGLMAHGMGIKKAPEVLALCRFKPGSASFNKGKKGVNGSSNTKFKAGQTPHTWLPIGSHRIDKDGCLVEKVADTRDKRIDWQPVHRLVWVKARGPVPAGHLVVFKPGRKTTDAARITADCVECIDRAENMRRNTVHRLPKELVQTIQLIGALNRQINKRTTK